MIPSAASSRSVASRGSRSAAALRRVTSGATRSIAVSRRTAGRLAAARRARCARRRGRASSPISPAARRAACRYPRRVAVVAASGTPAARPPRLRGARAGSGQLRLRPSAAGDPGAGRRSAAAADRRAATSSPSAASSRQDAASGPCQADEVDVEVVQPGDHGGVAARPRPRAPAAAPQRRRDAPDRHHPAARQCRPPRRLEAVGARGTSTIHRDDEVGREPGHRSGPARTAASARSRSAPDRGRCAPARTGTTSSQCERNSAPRVARPTSGAPRSPTAQRPAERQQEDAEPVAEEQRGRHASSPPGAAAGWSRRLATIVVANSGGTRNSAGERQEVEPCG